jgi:UDP-glucose:(heptosyl)LPS alpha-1,3-glucosyltransferase
MKIAYIVYDYYRPGGIERYVRNLAMIFSSQGHDVHILTTSLEQTKKTNIHIRTIHVPRWFPGFFQHIIFSGAVSSLCLAEHFDIIHNQGTDCIHHNVITAHSCHKAWVERAKTFSVWERLKKMLHPQHRRTLNREKLNYTSNPNQEILAVSRTVGNELIRYYRITSDHLTITYPGIEHERFNRAIKDQYRMPVRTRLGYQAGDRVILFVANEFRRKGLSTLIRALADLSHPSSKLLVVGKGNPWPYKLMGWILHVPITFILPTDHVEQYFACTDIFVLPTKHEAFGMVIVEAMAFGLPVLVSQDAGAAELISNHRCLIQHPSNFHEISSSLRYFFDHPEESAAIGEELRQIVLPHTWIRVAEETMRVYGRVQNG